MIGIFQVGMGRNSTPEQLAREDLLGWLLTKLTFFSHRSYPSLIIVCLLLCFCSHHSVSASVFLPSSFCICFCISAVIILYLLLYFYRHYSVSASVFLPSSFCISVVIILFLLLYFCSHYSVFLQSLFRDTTLSSTTLSSQALSSTEHWSNETFV